MHHDGPRDSTRRDHYRVDPLAATARTTRSTSGLPSRVLSSTT
jgi:hypothetical protein